MLGYDVLGEDLLGGEGEATPGGGGGDVGSSGTVTTSTAALGSFVLGEGTLGGVEEVSSTNLLTATQESDTLAATGAVTGAGSGGETLSATQAADTLAGSGTVTTPTPTVVRLVAILNGPAGYIKEVDANGLTDVDIRFNGFITLPRFHPNGTAGDKLRYYRDPASEAGALLAENVDTSWSMDLHRGNGFLSLGTFSVLDPVIGGGTVLGTVTASQASNTVAATAKVIVKGSRTGAQDPNTIIAVGGLPNVFLTGTLVSSQADNVMLTGTAKAVGRGRVSATQASNVALGAGTGQVIIGTLLGSADAGPLLDAIVSMDGLIVGEADFSPVVEGEVL